MRVEVITIKGEYMKIYKKLVRDFVPMMINAANEKAITRILTDDKEYEQELCKKMQEELNEYFQSGDIIELVDLGEVMHALLDLKGVSIQHYQELRLQKLHERGSYKKRMFLESVEKF